MLRLGTRRQGRTPPWRGCSCGSWSRRSCWCSHEYRIRLAVSGSGDAVNKHVVAQMLGPIQTAEAVLEPGHAAATAAEHGRPACAGHSLRCQEAPVSRSPAIPLPALQCRYLPNSSRVFALFPKTGAHSASSEPAREKIKSVPGAFQESSCGMAGMLACQVQSPGSNGCGDSRHAAGLAIHHPYRGALPMKKKQNNVLDRMRCLTRCYEGSYARDPWINKFPSRPKAPRFAPISER